MMRPYCLVLLHPAMTSADIAAQAIHTFRIVLDPLQESSAQD
jgi:hypothetical protein